MNRYLGNGHSGLTWEVSRGEHQLTHNGVKPVSIGRIYFMQDDLIIDTVHTEDERWSTGDIAC